MNQGKRWNNGEPWAWNLELLWPRSIHWSRGGAEQSLTEFQKLRDKSKSLGLAEGEVSE